MCRFVAAMILHINLLDDVKRSMFRMKYAMNHPYMFKNWFIAYIVGFWQLFVALVNESICIIVICMQLDAEDIVFNFIALTVICQFDDFIY
jgi:hypothetical protein